MTLLDKLSVLIVIPDLQSKTKLREVLRSVVYKGEVHYERSIKELDKKLADPITAKYDVAFISGKFIPADISTFLKGLRESSSKKLPSIIIALTSATSHPSGTIAAWYLEGVAGFISEPYTAEDLSELLTKVIEQRTKSFPIEGSIKARKASNFLLTDAINLVDEVARLSYEGKEGGYALKDLKMLSKSFADYFNQDPKGFEEALVESFIKAKAPAWVKAANSKKSKSKVAKHPGIVVWEILGQRGIGEDRLASLLKVEAEIAAALTRGNIAVDEALAQNLSRIFGMTPREWLKMQAEYDASKAAQAKKNG